MAEDDISDNQNNTMPQRGKVQKLRQEFMVHEDAGLAYQLQNEEIDKQFRLNRSNRRIVREDMKIAEAVKTDEEAQQQKRRFAQLQVLKAQVEEDERVAKGLMEQELLENETQKIAVELTDEEYAKLVHEEEKKKYENYLEREKQRKLKKEREEIGKTQQHRPERARLGIGIASEGNF